MRFISPDDLMKLAIEQARLAELNGDVPIGAVIHHQSSSQLWFGFNRRELDKDPTAHAEIVAIREAARVLGTWRLLDCTLAVTLEPCVMCAGAIINARIPRVIYGCDDPKAGAVRSLFSICADDRLNHRAQIMSGVRADECAELLRSFFQKQRSLGKK